MPEIAGEQIQEAHRRYLANRESEKRYQRIEVMMGLAVTGIILVFAVSTYYTVRLNYRGERLSTRLSETLASLSPEISKAVVDVGRDAMPIYLELSERKLTASIPRMQAAIESELDTLLASTNRQAREDFDAVFDRLARRLETRLQREFPALLDPETMGLFETELTAMVEQESGDFIGRFFDQYSKELNKLYHTAAGFKPNRFERLKREELEANYVHLWLMLLDKEIMGTH